MADPFHAFIRNLTVAMPGTTHGTAVISLPRSQVEMSQFDLEWQERITKVVRRVAKDLLANDETEVSEVVGRRLFDDVGQDRFRKQVSKDLCRLVLRAARTASAGMHAGGQRRHGDEGARAPAGALRDLLSSSASGVRCRAPGGRPSPRTRARGRGAGGRGRRASARGPGRRSASATSGVFVGSARPAARQAAAIAAAALRTVASFDRSARSAR